MFFFTQLIHSTLAAWLNCWFAHNMSFFSKFICKKLFFFYLTFFFSSLLVKQFASSWINQNKARKNSFFHTLFGEGLLCQRSRSWEGLRFVLSPTPFFFFLFLLYIRILLKGILVTCNTKKESLCRGETFRLLDAFVEKEYPNGIYVFISQW
jgi:hypothetical protein